MYPVFATLHFVGCIKRKTRLTICHFNMKWIILLCEVFVFIHLHSNQVKSGIVQDGPAPDIIGLTQDKIRTVNPDNCHAKRKMDLELPNDSVAQVSSLYWKQFFDVIYSNRSKLVHLHNTAMSKGYYYSFLYATLNHSKYYYDLPDAVYLYMKSSADVSANQGWVDGSALMFNNKTFYPNWYLTVEFNQTLSLFGIRSWKGSTDYETTWAREPIHSTNKEIITGSVFRDNPERNYTDQKYKYCPYTRHDGAFWWPDDAGIKRLYWKQIYVVGVKFSDTTGHYKTSDFENISFWGPPTPWARSTDLTLPVLITQPYYDCGRSNKWIISMTSPVTEFMTRYNSWNMLRRPR